MSGFVTSIISKDFKQAEITLLGVAPEFQGKGVGTLILATLE